MFTYEFTYANKSCEKTNVGIQVDDEIWHVTMGGKYLGYMEIDEDSISSYKTDSPALEDELIDLTMALKEAIAVDNLPSALHQLFGEVLMGWDWTGDKDLKIAVNTSVNLSSFAVNLRAQVNEVVLFERPLTIFLYQPLNVNIEGSAHQLTITKNQM